MVAALIEVLKRSSLGRVIPPRDWALAAIGLGVVLLMRARGRRVAATDRLPLGTLMALAAWPIWLILPL